MTMLADCDRCIYGGINKEHTTVKIFCYSHPKEVLRRHCLEDLYECYTVLWTLKYVWYRPCIINFMFREELHDNNYQEVVHIREHEGEYISISKL